MSPGREEVQGEARQEEHSEQTEQPVQSSVGEGASHPAAVGIGSRGICSLPAKSPGFVFLEAVGSHWNVLRSGGRQKPHT